MVNSKGKSRRRSWIFFGLYLIFFLYLFQNISTVKLTYWDEAIYINASRAYFTSPHPYPNAEHPPFGKELSALGMVFFGDSPVGWRFFSVAFGALACTLISYLTFRLTKRMGVALFIAALLFLEPLFVVHFRMGQLEAPLTGLLVLATVLTYLLYLDPKRKRWLLYPLTIVLGLALATKMLTVVFLPVLWGLLVYRLFAGSRNWKGIFHVSIAFAIIPLLVFQITYWVLGYSTGETVDLFKFMIAWHKSHRGPAMAFSRWYEWVYIRNPIWYLNRALEDDRVQVIMATGNFVLWIGAELASLYALIRNWRRPEIWMLALLVLIQFGLYALKPSTYLFYMTEILPFLFVLMGVAIGDLFDHYEFKYRRVLQIDLGLFFVAALVVFLNYYHYLWGHPITRERFARVSGIDMPQPQPSPFPSPLPQVTPGP